MPDTWGLIQEALLWGTPESQPQVPTPLGWPRYSMPLGRTPPYPMPLGRTPRYRMPLGRTPHYPLPITH